jgi:short-subunit dehydrogenase
MGSLANRVVWITGASAGIGAALARELAMQQAKLVLSARRVDRLEALAQDVAAAGAPEPLIAPLDLTNFDSHAHVAEAVRSHWGRIDVLVHNAGISQRGSALESDLGVVQRLIDVDLIGPISLTHAALPAMVEQGSGHFVVVSSLVGLFGTPKRSAYSAAKHGLHGYFESLEAELYDQGIRVTMICPGFIKTELTYHALTADGSEQGTMDRAQAKGMSAEECARQIARAIANRESLVLVGGREVVMAHIARFAPCLYRRLIRRVAVT